MKDYVEQLEKQDGYSFVDAWKSRSDITYVMFGESCGLFYSSLSDDGAKISHRGGMNLSLCGLRQALEIRFKRAIGVFRIFDDLNSEAKLRHDFIPDFIDDNRDLISLRFKSLTELMKIYKWTNYSIHNGCLPKIWEVDFAFEYCSDLFRPNKVTLGSWSIHSSIIITDYDELKRRFEERVCAEFKSGNWKFMYLDKPEAVIGG